MAASQLTATLNGGGPLLRYDSNSKFIDFSCRRSKSKLFLSRTMNPRPLRRSFLVRNVSSEPTQKLKNPIVEQHEGRLHLLLFLPFCSYYGCSCMVVVC